MSEQIEKFDSWLSDESDVAALTLRRWLEPIEGKDAVIFPPTYPLDERGPRVGLRRDGDYRVTVELPPYQDQMKEKDRGPAGYNIDRFEDGSNVCQIDSVGSQANRMEPIFMREPYLKLVPKVEIIATVDGKEKRLHLLEAGHRAADAIVMFSTLGPQIHEVFQLIRDEGNMMSLASICPTSLVFGVWDSRSTQVKLPRVVRSVIRAFNVRELHRSAQYTTIAGEILEGPNVEVTTKGVKAELGLAHVPSVMKHGGVQISGEIRQEAAINLVAIRSLAAAPGNKDDTLSLRRYILGLSLVALTAHYDLSLREGCQLVQDVARPAEWKLVKYDGLREDFALSHIDALNYASSVAEKFGIKKELTGQFNPAIANQIQALSKDDRKALLRQGSVTTEALQKLKLKNEKKGKKSHQSTTNEGDQK